MQQGRYVGTLISRHATGQNGLEAFRYFDKGNMAVVGKGYAILQSGKFRVHGLAAWLAWLGILMCGLSAGYLFAVLSHVYQSRHVKAPRRSPSQIEHNHENDPH